MSGRKILLIALSIFTAIIIMFFIGVSAAYYLFIQPAQLRQAEQLKLAHITRKTPLSEIVAMPTGEGNAAEDYIKALKTRGEAKTELRDSDLEHILRGTRKRRCDFRRMNYETRAGVLNYQVPTTLATSVNLMMSKPHFLRATRCAKALVARAEELLAQGKAYEARDIYERILIFGEHLESCSQTVLQWLVSCDVISIGASALEKFYAQREEPDKAVKVHEFLQQHREMVREVTDKFRAIVQNVEVACKVLMEDEDARFRREAAMGLAASRLFFEPFFPYPRISGGVSVTDDTVLKGKLFFLFERRRALRALQSAVDNDEVPSIRALAQDILRYAR